MRFCILSFTQSGKEKAEKLLAKKEQIQVLLENDTFLELRCFVKGRQWKQERLAEHIQYMEQSLSSFLKEQWKVFDVFIFIGACGIAVRSIAPFLKSKWEDPAVLVLDEKANFCISLLSGHVGGGNEYCQIIAQVMQSTPVITTATDVNHKFAVDVFARKNQLVVSDHTLAKEVSAYVLQQKEELLYFYDDFSDLSKEVYEKYQKQFLQLGIFYTKEKVKAMETAVLGIYLTNEKKEALFQHTLFLYPGNVSLGVGAKKGIEGKNVSAFFEEILCEKGWSKEMFTSVNSIDLKAKEKGIIEFCEEYAYPYYTYTKEELCNMKENETLDFSKSEFVEKTTGVDCVCERSAVLKQIKQNKTSLVLLVKKRKKNGVTLAVASARPTEFVIEK